MVLVINFVSCRVCGADVENHGFCVVCSGVVVFAWVW